MDREAFINIVYDLLSNDPDNKRANEIINAADQYTKEVVREILYKCWRMSEIINGRTD